MSMNYNLWNEIDVMSYCSKRMQELSKEEPVNGVAIKRYSEDLVTAAMGTRAFTVSTCEMLKELIKTQLELLQELCGTNFKSETPVYVTEAVRVAENFCNSQDQGGGADVSGKKAEKVGKKAEKILKQLDETEKILNIVIREQKVMAREKALEQYVMACEEALLERESALAAKEKALLERESTLAAKEKALLTRDLKDPKDARPGNDIGGEERASSTHRCRRCPEPVSEGFWYCPTHAFENGLIPETRQDEDGTHSTTGSRGGQRQSHSKIFDDLANLKTNSQRSSESFFDFLTRTRLMVQRYTSAVHIVQGDIPDVATAGSAKK